MQRCGFGVTSSCKHQRCGCDDRVPGTADVHDIPIQCVEVDMFHATTWRM